MRGTVLLEQANITNLAIKGKALLYILTFLYLVMLNPGLGGFLMFRLSGALRAQSIDVGVVKILQGR